MGDTQRSQTISPDNQRIAEHTVLSDVGFSGSNGDDFPVLYGVTAEEYAVHLDANIYESVDLLGFWFEI